MDFFHVSLTLMIKVDRKRYAFGVKVILFFEMNKLTINIKKVDKDTAKKCHRK